MVFFVADAVRAVPWFLATREMANAGFKEEVATQFLVDVPFWIQRLPFFGKAKI